MKITEDDNWHKLLTQFPDGENPSRSLFILYDATSHHSSSTELFATAVLPNLHNDHSTRHGGQCSLFYKHSTLFICSSGEQVMLNKSTAVIFPLVNNPFLQVQLKLKPALCSNNDKKSVVSSESQSPHQPFKHYEVNMDSKAVSIFYVRI